jgi:conjugative transfer signal peptidase TraF
MAIRRICRGSFSSRATFGYRLSGEATASAAPDCTSMPLRIRTTRPFTVIAMAGTLVLATRIAWPVFDVPLLINTTASEPYGLYRIRPRLEYGRGTLVLFPVPASVASLVSERGWLARGLPLLKGVGAIPGDRVCVSDNSVSVNGERVGPVFGRDSAGRPLPVIRGCETVAAGRFWPLSRYTAKSFDGRYMGAQPLAAIVGEAVPVWTF